MIRPTLRWASNADAKDIETILKSVGQLPEGIDFSEVSYGNWILAEHDDTIVGVAQVLYGKPLGHFGFWGVIPGYTSSGVGITLWKAVEAALRKYGADGFTGMTANEQVLKHLPEVGGIVHGESVKLLFKRVSRRKENGRKHQGQVHNGHS